MMEACKTSILGNGQFAHRVIILSESFSPDWLRLLRDTCKVNVIHLENNHKNFSKSGCPFYDYLELCEGVPGRAKMCAYAQMYFAMDKPVTSPLAMSRVLLTSRLDDRYREWCQQALVQD
jgi:hypothetical protein